LKEKEAKEAKEFFRTSYDGLLHPDHIPVDEFGEPVVGEVVRRAIEVHAEVHEIKVGGGEPPVTNKEEDHRKMIEGRLRKLAEDG
jgi:hypothetical protein